MKLNQLETPALIVNETAMQANLEKMIAMLKGTPMQLRPHYKTIKSTTLAHRQVAAGAKGITCAKLGEAEDLAQAGIADILIANQVVQPDKIARLARLASRCRLTVCVDNADNVRALSLAAEQAGSTINCYVELDVGMKRCGVSTFEDFYMLAKLLAESPGLRYGGIQAYAGNLAHEYDTEKREGTVQSNEQRLKDLIAYLEERGVKSENVSGGSTGTAYLKAQDTVYTEIQAGSFMFMDVAYGDMGLGFENALFVAGTVISVWPTHFVLDCGVKTISPDQGPPRVVGYEGHAVKLSEEHLSVYGSHTAKLGDMIRVIPGHCCATVNLFDNYCLFKGDEVTGYIPVTSRGKSR